MSNPITWQNVRGDGAEPTRALIPLTASQNTFNGVFDAFSNILKERQAIERANTQVAQENAKQAFLNKLAAIETPEQLVEMQRTGQLDVSGLPVAVQAAVRGADEARLTGLRQSKVAEQSYNDAQKLRASLPLRQQVAALTANKDFAGARKLLDTNDLGDEAPLYTGIATAERGQVVQGREDETYVHGVKTRDIALKNAKLNLTEAEQKAKDADEVRRLENAVARANAEFAGATQTVGLAQGKLAEDIGLPLTSNGFPDFSNMDSEQVLLFNEQAERLGVPPSSTTTTGDTERGDRLLKQFSDSGEYSPRVIRANEAAIRAAAATSPKPLVGNDAANVALATAQNTVGYDRQDAGNWYAPNSPDARKAYEDLAAKIPDIVKSSTNGLDAAEDVEDVQRLIGDIGSVGIKRKDGTYVVPSVNDVMRFVRQSEGGWFRDATRANNIRNELTTWVNSKEALEMAKKGEESQRFRDKQRVKQLLLEAGNPPKK